MKVHLAGITSLEEFHDLLQQHLEFPVYYGRNLDAFWDCLTDITGEVHVDVVGFSELPSSLSQEIRGYLDLMREHESETKGKFSVAIH